MESNENKYMTFNLKNEHYGIPINVVKEIIAMLEITEVPRTPEYIKGVVNLRGKIIPILDLRLKLGLEELEYNERTCIIVVDINTEKISKKIGVAVDSVSEVVDIPKDIIEPITDSDTQVDGDFITGIGKLKSKVVMILDVEKIMSKKETEKILKIGGDDKNV